MNYLKKNLLVMIIAYSAAYGMEQNIIEHTQHTTAHDIISDQLIRMPTKKIKTREQLAQAVIEFMKADDQLCPCTFYTDNRTDFALHLFSCARFKEYIQPPRVTQLSENSGACANTAEVLPITDDIILFPIPGSPPRTIYNIVNTTQTADIKTLEIQHHNIYDMLEKIVHKKCACGHQFPRGLDLIEHILHSHTRDFSFVCPREQCLFAPTNNIHEILDHVSIHTSEQLICTCTFCSHTQDSYLAIKLHLAQEHARELTQTTTDAFIVAPKDG